MPTAGSSAALEAESSRVQEPVQFGYGSSARTGLKVASIFGVAGLIAGGIYLANRPGADDLVEKCGTFTLTQGYKAYGQKVVDEVASFDGSSSEISSGVACAVEFTGGDDFLIEQISETNGFSGVQRTQFNGWEYVWSYHSSRGLEMFVRPV